MSPKAKAARTVRLRPGAGSPACALRGVRVWVGGQQPLGGIVAENIGRLALYSESTLKAAQYENRALLKRRYENKAL